LQINSSDGYIIGFALDDKSSFEETMIYFEMAEATNEDNANNIPIVLVG
jgi:hypothetical protein